MRDERNELFSSHIQVNFSTPNTIKDVFLLCLTRARHNANILQQIRIIFTKKETIQKSSVKNTIILSTSYKIQSQIFTSQKLTQPRFVPRSGQIANNKYYLFIYCRDNPDTNYMLRLRSRIR